VFRLIRKLIFKRASKPVQSEPVDEVRLVPFARARKPEWQRVITSSLEQNCMAASSEAVLHAFDLYSEDLFAPCIELERRMADSFAKISAAVAELQALAPDLIDRAMSRHPYEFSHVIERKEDR